MEVPMAAGHLQTHHVFVRHEKISLEIKAFLIFFVRAKLVTVTVVPSKGITYIILNIYSIYIYRMRIQSHFLGGLR